MPSPKQPSDDDGSARANRKVSANKRKPGNVPVTPTKRRSSSGQTPKSAPAASGLARNGSGEAIGNRQRRPSQAQKSQPTLLNDFLLGRQTPARISATHDIQRKKTADSAAVKAELRRSMRKSSVRKLQQPGGVRERVKTWQKVNGVEMALGDPEGTPSEPTDVAIDVEEKSVTEEDRLRIRARKRRRNRRNASSGRPKSPKADNDEPSLDSGDQTQTDEDDEENTMSENEKSMDDNKGDSKDDLITPKKVRTPKPRIVHQESPNPLSPNLGSPPKKRIVSDDNWMKRKKRTSPRNGSARKLSKTNPGPAPIPKDFLQRTARNPTVQSKIKDWANRVETPESPNPDRPSSPRSVRSARSARHARKWTADEKETRTEDGKTGSNTSSNNTAEKVDDKSWHSTPDDGIRVRPLRIVKSVPKEHSTPQREQSKGSKNDLFEDGIRVRPISADRPSVERRTRNPDEEIAAPPKTRFLPNDGIRVRPIKSPLAEERVRARPSRKLMSQRDSSARTPSPTRTKSQTVRRTYVVRSAPAKTKAEDPLPEPKRLPVEEDQTVPDTPTRRPKARNSPKMSGALPKRNPSPTEDTRTDASTQTGSLLDDSKSARSLSGAKTKEPPERTYEPSIAPQKSLAEIPVGFSAFSELDLSGGYGRPRGTARNPSFNAAHVLKRVVSEGKKIIQEKAEPSRPTAANQPPSIENWLNGTVDPFVDAPAATQPESSAQRRHSIEEEWNEDVRHRSSETTKHVEEQPAPRAVKAEHDNEPAVVTTPLRHKEEEKPLLVTTPAQEPVIAVEAVAQETPDKSTPKSRPMSGLHRSGATRSRSTSSPAKYASVKKPFREALREAFHGESGSFKPTEAYHSHETDRGRDRSRDWSRDRSREQSRGRSRDYDYDRTHDRVQETEGGRGHALGRETPHSRNNDNDRDTSAYTSHRRSSSDMQDSRRHSSGGNTKRDLAPTLGDQASTMADSERTSSFASSGNSSENQKRRPPTSGGGHALSTIVSVESLSTRPSDAMSAISETTVTQNTTVTQTTGDTLRQGSQKPANGLKRRLTKHSDLVSVLSLPEDSQLPARTRSIRLARSLHRKTSKLDNATLADLLREFAEDENLYQRELKTLADGVIPVLLTQFVQGDAGRHAADVSGTLSGSQKADPMSRPVVNMGIALEKLKTLHKWVPLHDAPRMVQWLDSVYPVYDSYLDAWRLGFQGVIVNLAPAAGKMADEDSLVNAMDRNEDGDVLDENGERVDVAYLLRRPLVRIKWMLKFAKGANIILGGGIARDVVDKLEVLQEKARRRHREETARKADEDANATDTTRARSVRNLAALDNVRIDQTRQVSAKDWFDLDMVHSNGQRLSCQVEMVFRDKPSDRSDRGDVLIRETGSGGRSWLLFPPFYLSQLSARQGPDKYSLLVMARDVYNGREWYELMTVFADHEDTAADWLDILGTDPIPPSASGRSLAKATQQVPPSPRAMTEGDIPLGERRTSTEKWQQESPKMPKKPVRYHHRTASTPSTRTNSMTDSERTPTMSTTYSRSSSGQPPMSQISSAWEPSWSRTPGDSTPSEYSRLMRPTARAPLRQEGPPAPPVHKRVRSQSPPVLSPPVESSAASSRAARRRTSSPLKHEFRPSDISSESDSTTDSSSGTDSDSSDDELEEDDVPDALPGISIKKPMPPMSECSITPSHSASQAGRPNVRTAPISDYTHQFMASISYWSNNKGVWRDLGDPINSVIIAPGLIEVFSPGIAVTEIGRSPGVSGSSDVDNGTNKSRPLIALDLTPLVMIRQSTMIDLEIRSPVRSYSKYNQLDAGIFRFRASSPADLTNFYAAVHQSRMNNAKFKALEEEARYRSFGQQGSGEEEGKSKRRSWFGRKNSYRASARAPSQSQGSSSSISATSFLRKLTGGNLSFNIDQSSVDKQSGGGGGSGSLYTSSGSSSLTGSGNTPPRSPSISLAGSGNRGAEGLGSSDIKMRCHLQVGASKWEDHGNCVLSISRPPPGVRQELTIYHGLEKRILVMSIPKKEADKPLVILDVVVGSKCFARLAARGIVLNVWEALRDEQNRIGSAPAEGAIAGHVKKWCFQFASESMASWVYGLVASEVAIV